MKKYNLTKAVFAALLLASPLAMADSEYPAADFEPVVITQDADLIAKHEEAAKARAVTMQSKAEASSSVSSAASVEQPGSGAEAAKAENPLAENYPIGLIVLGLVGFIFWSGRQSKSKAPVQAVQQKPAVVSGEGAAETGVAKYLKNLSEPVKAAAAETGVAKYLKNLPEPVKAAAAETGVAKYLKNIQ